MGNTLIAAFLLCLAGLAGWFLHGSRAAWTSQSRGPTIEMMEQLASLAVLHVQIADVQVCELHGYTGGIQAVVVIKGDAEIATDLTAARLEGADADRRRAVLVLSDPVARRPRVDHSRTRVYRIDRSGLWRILPGNAGETDLLNQALAQAQRMIEEAGSQPPLIDQARQRAEEVVRGLASAAGWQLELRWAGSESGHTGTGA